LSLDSLYIISEEQLENCVTFRCVFFRYVVYEVCIWWETLPPDTDVYKPLPLNNNAKLYTSFQALLAQLPDWD